MGFRVPETWSLKDRDVLTEGPRSSGIFKSSWRRSPLAQTSRSWSCLHTFFSHIFVLNYPFLFLWFSNFLPLNFLFFLLLNLVIIYLCYSQLDKSERRRYSAEQMFHKVFMALHIFLPMCWGIRSRTASVWYWLLPSAWSGLYFSIVKIFIFFSGIDHKFKTPKVKFKNNPHHRKDILIEVMGKDLSSIICKISHIKRRCSETEKRDIVSSRERPAISITKATLYFPCGS